MSETGVSETGVSETGVSETGVSETATSSRLRTIGASLHDAWRLARPYFAGPDKLAAWTLLVGTLLLNLAGVGLSVLFNYWYGALNSALQQYDADGFYALMFTYRWSGNLFLPGFVTLAAAIVAVGVLSVFTQQLLEIRWRRWLTHHLLDRYLNELAYYRIAIAAPGDAISTDNPDQRISDDIHDYCRSSLTLGFDLISNVVSLFSFVAILWGLSGTFTLFGVDIPGSLVLLTVAYSLVGTILAHYVGRPLASITFARQRVEANFRFGLIHMRTHAESVALSGGEPEERRMLSGRFGAIVGNFLVLLRRTLFINAYGSGFQQIAVVFPFIVSAPRFFSKAIDLGGLLQIVDGFSQVNKALAWFVSNYIDLANYRATVDRLGRFEAAMQIVDATKPGAVITEAEGADLTADDLTIRLPDGRTLLQHGSLRFRAGEPVVIAGRSGGGKSTLFRTLAGIWPFAEGRVSRPQGRWLFLPQRPYLPLGTLRHAICYPDDPASFSNDQVAAALHDLGLDHLRPELDADIAAAGWQTRLSGGEQQRLALTRALLIRPDWLFLDEATGSLDPAGEAEVYGLLRARLPRTTVVSIAHRTAVAAPGDRRLVLDPASAKLQPELTTASTAGP